MGCCKQLLPLDGVPAVMHCLETLHRGGIEAVIVVVGGPYREQVASALETRGVLLAHNLDLAGDMASSLSCAIPLLSENCAGVALLPADIPCVLPTTISRLRKTFLLDPTRIVIPSYRMRRGHPIFMPTDVFANLIAQTTLREVVAAHAANIIHMAVDDEGILLDMDTPQDYRELNEHGRLTRWNIIDVVR